MKTRRCNIYATGNLCNANFYRTYMEKYCARTCKFCNDKEITTTTKKETTSAETTSTLFPSSKYSVVFKIQLYKF